MQGGRGRAPGLRGGRGLAAGRGGQLGRGMRGEGRPWGLCKGWTLQLMDTGGHAYHINMYQYKAEVPCVCLLKFHI